MMRALACVLGIVGLLPASAEADVSKAFAAAKDNLPASTQILVTIDVGAIQKSPLFPKFVDAFKSMDRDIGEMHDLLKTACGQDPFSVIDGIVIAGIPQKNDAVVLYLQLTIDRTKASKCLESALRALPKGKTKNAVVTQQGDYTVAKIGDKPGDSAYFPWVAPNVVMVSMKPEKKDVVDAWFKQKTFGQSRLAGMLGKLDAKAVVSGAFASDGQFDKWVPVTSAYGNWTLGGGKVSGALVATATDAKAAKSLADEINQEVQRDLKRDKAPPSVKKLVRSVSITSSGAELTIKGTATEAELGAAFGELFTKKKVEKPATDMLAAVAKMEGFSKSMCACKDKACADKVNADMTKWGTEMAKKGDSAGKPDPASMKRITEVMTRYAECMTKLMTP